MLRAVDRGFMILGLNVLGSYLAAGHFDLVQLLFYRAGTSTPDCDDDMSSVGAATPSTDLIVHTMSASAFYQGVSAQTLPDATEHDFVEGYAEGIENNSEVDGFTVGWVSIDARVASGSVWQTIARKDYSGSGPSMVGGGTMDYRVWIGTKNIEGTE